MEMVLHAQTTMNVAQGLITVTTMPAVPTLLDPLHANVIQATTVMALLVQMLTSAQLEETIVMLTQLVLIMSVHSVALAILVGLVPVLHAVMSMNVTLELIIVISMLLVKTLEAASGALAIADSMVTELHVSTMLLVILMMTAMAIPVVMTSVVSYYMPAMMITLKRVNNAATLTDVIDEPKAMTATTMLYA